ncbi:hypothetical protein PQR63_09795 [Herbaspirillum rhizosphaerae]|uniref:Uncharacterized protein n=1 Tax=Herbaspirillum rhizosphaerae TaxID=346179 RepID=A0ABW8Z825_9BURK
MRLLRRLLAVFAFVAGGLAAELAKPLYCSLLNVASATPARRRKRAKV